MALPRVNKFLREEKYYHNKEVVVVEMIGIRDNKFDYYEKTLSKEEAELLKFVKFNNNLTNEEKDHLWNLIENYGQDKYEDGQEDVHMQNAGEDL